MARPTLRRAPHLCTPAPTRATSRWVVDRADSTDYEPMMVEGGQVGEAHWLRTAGSGGNPHEACLRRTSAPAGYEHLFTGEESFYVLRVR